MTGSRSRPRPWLRTGIAGLAVLAVALGFLLFRDGPNASTIESTTLDWRFRLRGPLAAPDGVVILAIDDATVAMAGGFPLPRAMLGEAVTQLAASGAVGVGINLLLLDPEPPSDGLEPSAGDRKLLDALRRAPPAVLSFALTFADPVPLGESGRAALAAAAFPVVRAPAGTQGEALLRASGAVLPMAPLLEVAAVGHANVPVDADGSLRHLYLGVALGEDVLPALPVALARQLLGVAPSNQVLTVGRSLALGGREIALDRRTRLVLDFYGPPGTIRTISLADLLEGRVGRAEIEGRVALIGATALGVGDSFVTPFSRSLPGVEVLATAVANLALGGPLDHGARAEGISLLAILLLGAIAFAATRVGAPLVMAALSAALLLGWAAIATFAFIEARLWLDITFPSAAILVATAIGFVGRILAERGLRRDFQRQRGNLLRYHSPLVGELLAETDTAAVADREQSAAILFVDMAGFTRRAETLAPADTARFLRAFHRHIETAALAHGGVLEQFTGDGAMVVFGMPSPKPDDAASALGCARRLIEEIRSWNRELAATGQAALEIRIGVHFGPVALATLGGEAQRQMAVAGDTVNVASRLEALARQHGAIVAVSDAVVEAVRAAGKAPLLDAFEALPPQAIRGRSASLGVWVLRQTVLATDRG